MGSVSAVKIHDTTLRDGEQMAGVVFSFEEKLKLAEKSMEFGTDLIDVMPAVSEAEFKITGELASRYGTKISAACRCKKSDIDIAIDAGASRIELISPLSDLHITQKLRITREENLANALKMIDYARGLGLIVDIAGEDASRADLEYLKLFLEAVDGKISVFFLSDTVGCLTPESTKKLVWCVKNNFSGSVCLHVHDDFGMATANTVEGVLAGADYFSGTFTGIGERAGNAPIEEVCAALHFLHGVDVGVKYTMMKEICDMVQEFSGAKLQRHKAIVGENAFSHQSGIHVDGMLKNTQMYEFIAPESVGQKRKFYFGKHTGAAIIKKLFGENANISGILGMIKELAESGKTSFSEEELRNLVEKMYEKQLLVVA